MSEPSRDVDAPPTGGQGVKLSQSPRAAAAPPRAGDEPASLGQQLKGHPSTPQASSHYAHGYRGPYGFPAWHQASGAEIPAGQPFAANPNQRPYRYAVAPAPTTPASFANPAHAYGGTQSTWSTNPLASAYPTTAQPNNSPMQQPSQYGFYDLSTPSPYRSLGQYYPSLSPGYGMQPPAPYYAYPPLHHTSPSPQASPYQHGYQFQAPLAFGGSSFYQVPANGPRVTYQPQSGEASAAQQQHQHHQHHHLGQHNAAQVQGAGGAPAATAQGDSGSASIKKERNLSPPQVPAALDQDSTALPFQPATLILRPTGGHQRPVASSSSGQTTTHSSVVGAPRVQPTEAPNREATVGGSVEEEDSRDSPAALPHLPAASADDSTALESRPAATESQEAASQDSAPAQDDSDGPVAFDDDDESVPPPHAEQAGHGPEPAQAGPDDDDAMNLDTRADSQPQQAAGSDDEMPDVLPDDDSETSLSPCPTPVEEPEATQVADQDQPADEDHDEQLPLEQRAPRRELAKCRSDGCGRLLGFHNKYGLCPAHKCVGCNGPKDKDDWRCALCMAKREENAQKKQKRASTAAEKRAPAQQQSGDTQQQSEVAGESHRVSQPEGATTSDPDPRPYNLRRNRRQTQFFGSPPRPEVAEPDDGESDGPGSAAGRDDDVALDPESEWVTDDEEVDDNEMQVDEQEDDDVHNEEENDAEHDDQQAQDLDEMDVDDAEEADDEADTPASLDVCTVDGCDGPVESNTRGNTLCKNHKCNGPYCNGLRREGFVHCEICGASIRAANRKWREKRKREAAAGAKPRTCAKDGCDEPLHNRNTSNLCRAHKCRRCPNIARPGLHECEECYEEAKAKWRAAAAAARRRRETLARAGGGPSPSAARRCPVAGCGFELSSHARSVFCHNHKCTMCLERAAPGHRKCKPCLALSSERARKLVETQRAEGKCTIYKCDEPAIMGPQGGMGKCEAHLKRDYGYHKKYNDKKREEK